MKIQYMSDLHLEFTQNREYFKENPIEPIGDVLVLAGDIVCDIYRDEASEFFKDVESKFKFVISTMGNHEFYSSEISYAYPSYKKYFSKNHVTMNNEAIIIDKTKFIVSVLWSKIDPLHELEIKSRLTDYRLIKKLENDVLIDLIPKDTDYYHKISVDFIEKELQNPFDGKIVLITHHLPSFFCVNPKWKNNTIISAFVTNLDKLIHENKIDAWIFGHQHESFSDFLGNTKMLCNPLGYSKEDNFNFFRSNKIFEV